MTWRATDKKQLWSILGLDRDQLIDGSTLEFLMRDLENFDVNYGTSLVSDVQVLINEIEEINLDNPPVYNTQGDVKRIKVDGEIETEYFEKDKGGDTKQKTIQSKKTRILEILDPDQSLLKLRSSYARVII